MRDNALPRLPATDLVADIGGTHARFARVGPDGRPGPAIQLEVAAYPSLEDALAAARDALPGAPIRRAALALAAPIGGDSVALTNAGWSFSREAARAALGLEHLLLLNDFTALAWSLPLLAPEELRPIGAGAADAGAARALIGPGTGLGVSGLVPAAHGGWAAIAGEGGHASLAPCDPREAAILAWVWRSYPHVSAERLVSGSGLPLLHAAVGAIDGFTGPEAGDTPDASSPSAALITARALGGDPHARATLECFCALLGAAAGNLALVLGARGGVYIGGGIAPRIADFLAGSSFRARFEAKGRFAAYLAAIPVWLIDADNPALRGAAHALAQCAPPSDGAPAGIAGAAGTDH